MAEIIQLKYPHYITNDEWMYRCVKILVKEQTSLAAAAKDLEKNIEQTVKDLGAAWDTAWKKISGTSDVQRQKNITTRSKNIVNANTVFGIALPLPNELNDSQAHRWESTKGLVGRLGDTFVNDTTANKIMAEMASTSGFRKPLIDPGYFQDYKGTEPRTFDFTFDLIPNNQEEADQIFQIIYFLKKYTLPTSTINGISMQSPYLFDLEIGNPRISSLMNMTNVVCTSLSLNYAADGGMQLLPDGTPKYIRLTMSFAERITVTADMY